MSVTIETIISCDGSNRGCQDTFAGSDARYLSAKQQRASYERSADASGRWRYVNGKDYCPICWAARTSSSANTKDGGDRP